MSRPPQQAPGNPPPPERRCTATSRRTGKRCGQWAIPGGKVCRWHGGAAPQVQRTARLRLAELVDPAIIVLGRAMTDPEARMRDRIRAADSVLDRTGYARRLEVTPGEAYEELLERIAALKARRAEAS